MFSCSVMQSTFCFSNVEILAVPTTSLIHNWSLHRGEACRWLQVWKAKFFQSKKLFAATLFSFSLEDRGISCPKVFLWSCRRLRLNRVPSVCKWMYFPSSLLMSHLSIMLKRTVNGDRVTRRLSLKPSKGLWQVVALSDLDGSSSKPAVAWLFQHSPKTFSAHGVKCLTQIDKCVRLFSYICPSSRLSFANERYKIVQQQS